MKPIVHAYVVCWNEEKIIPHFLKHYDSIVDKFIIYDNESTDKSVEILKNNPKVELVTYKTGSTLRDDAYLVIKNNEWKKSIGVADIVIVCDQDEFLYTENLEETIIDFHQSNATIVKAVGYNMMEEHFDHDNCDNIFSVVKSGASAEMYSKQAMFKPGKIKDINYSFGCHYANPVGEISYFDKEIKLLHCRQLDIDYFISRVAEYQKRLSDFNKKHNLGHHYLKSLDEWRTLFYEDLKLNTKII